MTAASVATFLFGCLAGACGVLALTGLALYFVEWRSAWRGQEISGEELERAKKRDP